MLSEQSHLCWVAGRVRERQESLIASLRLQVTVVVVAVTADPASEVHVLLLDSHALGVDGTKVSVLEKTYDVGFRSLLESLKSLRLEAQGVVSLGCDSANQALERGTWKQHVDALLVSLDFTKSDSSGLETPATLTFLHATLGWGSLLHSVGAFNLSRHLGGGFGFGSSF